MCFFVQISNSWVMLEIALSGHMEDQISRLYRAFFHRLVRVRRVKEVRGTVFFPDFWTVLDLFLRKMSADMAG